MPLDLAQNGFTSTVVYEDLPERHPSLQSREHMNSVGTDNFSAQDSFKPLNTKEIRLHCRQTDQRLQESDKKRFCSQ